MKSLQLPTYVAPLVESSAPHVFTMGSVVVEEGTSDTRLFILEEGKLSVRKRLVNDDHKVLATLESPCTVFGEISFLTGRPRSADVVAEVNSKVFVLPRASLLQKLERDPELGSRFYKQLSISLAEKLAGQE